MKLLFAVFAGSLLWAQSNGDITTMIKMNVRLTGPGIRSGSYPALPKLIYRAGTKYARMENAPDAKARIQKVIIIAEPDAYSVDLNDHTGTHAIDQGGPNDLHLPMVLPLDPMHKLKSWDRLEFGAESEFFKKAEAVKSEGPLVNGKPTDKYVLTQPGASAELITKADSDIPIFMSWKTKEGTYRYEYSLYTEEPFRADLFERPDGVKFKEIPPPDPNEGN